MGTKASNARELALLPHYNSLSTKIEVSKPTDRKGDKYADFLLTKDGKSTWLEDKKTIGDRLMNVGAKYFNGSWVFNGSPNKFSKQLTPLLNKEAEWFVEKFNITVFDNNQDKLFTDLLEYQNAGNLVKITDPIVVSNMGELISDYYNNSKAEPCHYIQMGDNFYMLGDDNPLELNSEIPKLTGSGTYSLRFCINTKKGKDGIRRPFNVRTKPETGFDIDKLTKSPFSLMEGTKKLNPFK